MISIRQATDAEREDAIKNGEAVKGVWWPIALKDRKTAMLSCPGCGSFQSLEKWDISAAGVVSPSIDHSVGWDLCKFHDFITLDGWSA